MRRILFCLPALLCALIFVFSGCAPEGQTEGPVYHTVTFDSRGGSAVPSRQVLNGNPVRRPETPVREGYFLNGWYTDEGAAEDEWEFDVDRVTGDITLYAGWTEEERPEPTASLVYELNEAGDGWTVTDVGEETQIVIPAEHEGLPVTAIRGPYGTGAFARSAVTVAYIPDSVEVIGQNSFHNCSSLTRVVLSADSHLSEIGNNAFSGCAALESFYLPAGAVSLGDSVFNNCGSLRAFTVAEGNGSYRAENGHLIERATNTLVRGGHDGIVPDGVTSIAQAAFRRTSGMTELYIPASVGSLGNYFIADSTVRTILYAGTEAEWEAVEKTDMWNYGNREVRVEFEAERPGESGGVLVAYFSATGNTERVAGLIAEAVSGTLWEIVPAVPYTAEDLNYSNSGCRANLEQNDDSCRPAIAGRVEDMSAFGVVFVGYPIWWGDAPRIVRTFLESYDFSGIRVCTFSTSGSSSGSGAFNALCGAYAQIDLTDNLHLTSRTLADAETLVAEWTAGLALSA